MPTRTHRLVQASSEEQVPVANNIPWFHVLAALNRLLPVTHLVNRSRHSGAVPTVYEFTAGVPKRRRHRRFPLRVTTLQAPRRCSLSRGACGN